MNGKPTGVELITAERDRQITEEGWTAEHDNAQPLAMSRAAMCYLLDVNAHTEGKPAMLLTLWWPWSMKWWKPTPNDPVRQLVKAGALIAAEIDRIQRVEK